MIKNILCILGATVLMLWILGSFIPDAHSKQDCDYVKIVKYSDGDIISAKTEYVCDTEPEILIDYEKSKAEKLAEYFKPIRPNSEPDPSKYYGNYADNKFTILDIFTFGVWK